METFPVRTRRHTQFVDITREIESAAAAMGLRHGVLTVFVPHTTAGITINENADPSVTADMAAALDRAVPGRPAIPIPRGMQPPTSRRA